MQRADWSNDAAAERRSTHPLPPHKKNKQIMCARIWRSSAHAPKIIYTHCRHHLRIQEPFICARRGIICAHCGRQVGGEGKAKGEGGGGGRCSAARLPLVHGTSCHCIRPRPSSCSFEQFLLATLRVSVGPQSPHRRHGIFFCHQPC